MMIRKLLILGVLFLLLENAHAQSLDSLFHLAVENNLELKALQLEYEAELQKVDQVSQLPDPTLGVGAPLLRPETRLGPQVMMISASQMFPWFGTFKAKEDVVLSMSKAKYERIAAQRLELFNKLKIAYYKLQFLEEKGKIIEDNILQFEALKSVATSMVEGGSASIANVLRIQLKIDDLKQSLKKLSNSKKQFYAEINALTFQPWETEITPEKSDLSAVLVFDLEAFRTKIQTHYPLILKLDWEIEVSQNQQLVNQNMGAPKFGIGIDYSIVSERTDMNPEFNGRDIFVPKIAFSIPLYRKSYKAKHQEEVLKQNALEYQKEALETHILSLLIQFKADYENALLDIELNNGQIETTRSIYQILLSNYSTSGRGFDELLQIQNQFLNYHLTVKNAEMMALIAKANIDKYTDY